jgi:hypothetical protein
MGEGDVVCVNAVAHQQGWVAAADRDSHSGCHPAAYCLRG